MTKRKRRREGKQSRFGREQEVAAGGPHITTPEGDPVMIATVRYGHDAPEEVFAVLQESPDFEPEDDPEGTTDWQVGEEESRLLLWFGTPSAGPRPPAPLARRIVASVTLMPTTLEAEAMSVPRLDRCRQRLEELLGARIRLLETRTKSLEQAMADQPLPDFEDFDVPPPEYLAEVEEKILRQWIDESIPALGGLTPREAVKTPGGRRKVLELIEEGEETRRTMSNLPGTFAPDYRKAKKMLGLE